MKKRHPATRRHMAVFAVCVSCRFLLAAVDVVVVKIVAAVVLLFSQICNFVDLFISSSSSSSAFCSFSTHPPYCLDGVGISFVFIFDDIY